MLALGPSTVSITSNEVPDGLVNSSNVDYTTASAYVSGSLQVYINGLRQALTTHFTETTPASGTFAMGDAPTTGDIITVSYQTAATATGNADTLDNFHAASFYPVGTIYTNKTNSANPSTYLPGMAATTWTALEGVVVVGKASAGTFSTAGATGGAETITLTAAMIPAHKHVLSVGDGNLVHGGSSGSSANITQGGGQWRYANNPSTNDNTGGGGSHANLQPYVVAYAWERTA